MLSLRYWDSLTNQSFTKAATRSVLQEKVSLEISLFPCEFYEISKNTFLTEHLWVTASGFIGRSLRSNFKIILVLLLIKFTKSLIKSSTQSKVYKED